MIPKAKMYKWVFLILGILAVVTVVIVLVLPNPVKERAKEVERKFTVFVNKIDTEGLKPSFHVDAREDNVDKVKMLCDVGLGGVPLILQKLSEEPEEYMYFYTMGVYGLLSLNESDVVPHYDIEPEKMEFDMDRRGYLRLQKLLLDSKTKIPEILGSNLTMEEKIDRLSLFGVLAIPYLQKSSLTEELAAYCVSIELYLPPESRGDVAPEKLIIPEEEEARLKAEFDYQKWLSDNKYDLILLQKYVDGLTG